MVGGNSQFRAAVATGRHLSGSYCHRFSLYMYVCDWLAQIPYFYLNYQTITLQGHFRVALHKFRPQLAFLCFGHANFPSYIHWSNALRNYSTRARPQNQ